MPDDDPVLRLTPAEVSQLEKALDSEPAVVPQLRMDGIRPGLRTRVFESLDHAITNGYDMVLQNPAAEVAADLSDYDSDLEGESAAQLTQLVTEWRAARSA
jgi:hypothetical protein